MADKDVLTQEEIDALLSGVDDGSVDTACEEEGSSVLAAYDLAAQEPTVFGRLPRLELICERFSRIIRRSLPSNLKIPIELGPSGVQVQQYGEFIDGLFVPTCVKILDLAPLHGRCLLTMDAKLVHHIVNRFFGGVSASANYEGNEFSQTEQRVIDRITDLLLNALEDAWREILPITASVSGAEINPTLINLVPSRDSLLVTSFRLDLDEVGGQLNLCYPASALEPYKALLENKAQQQNTNEDAQWNLALEQALLDLEVPLKCVIGHCDVKLWQMLRLEKGDVLDIDMHETHQVTANGIPAFTASLGNSRGRFALECDRLGSGY